MYRKNSSGWVKHVDFILLDLLCIQLDSIFPMCVGWENGIPTVYQYIEIWQSL